MFEGDKAIEDYDELEKNEARLRYMNAISASVQGTAIVVLTRKMKDYL